MCILVHHNSCGGCKQYIPNFIKASINDHVDSDVVFGMIDIDHRQNPLFLKRVSFTNRLPYSRDLPERFSEMGTTKPVVTVLSLQSFE